jgi:radical SAM superfamily enzyme YgiQ (UPF0313 family)
MITIIRKKNEIIQIIVYSAELGGKLELKDLITPKETDEFSIEKIIKDINDQYKKGNKSNDSKRAKKIALKYYYNINDIIEKNGTGNQSEQDLIVSISNAIENYNNLYLLQKKQIELQKNKEILERVSNCMNVYQQYKKQSDLVQKLQESILKNIFETEYNKLDLVENDYPDNYKGDKVSGKCFFLVIHEN